jgi:hypothetical protein
VTGDLGRRAALAVGLGNTTAASIVGTMMGATGVLGRLVALAGALVGVGGATGATVVGMVGATGVLGRRVALVGALVGVGSATAASTVGTVGTTGDRGRLVALIGAIVETLVVGTGDAIGEAVASVVGREVKFTNGTIPGFEHVDSCGRQSAASPTVTGMENDAETPLPSVTV